MIFFTFFILGMYPQRTEASTPISIHVSIAKENLALPPVPYLPAIQKLLEDNPKLVPGLQNVV